MYKLRNLAIICHTTKLAKGMGLFLVWCHRLICIVLSLCKHACIEVCDVNSGIDPYSLLARSAACKKSRFGLKRGKKAQCVSNRCNDLFEQNKYFGVKCTVRKTVQFFKVRLFHISKFSAPTIAFLAFWLAKNSDYEPIVGVLRHMENSVPSCLFPDAL